MMPAACCTRTGWSEKRSVMSEPLKLFPPTEEEKEEQSRKEALELKRRLDAFAEKMNETAARLGMRNSHFVNAHGYSAEGHYTTARDLVTAARHGMTQALFSRIVTCLRYTLPANEQRKDPVISLKWEIFNPLSEYYIPNAAGVKSGYTSTAGFCYVGAYQENGITLIAAVMGGQGRNMAWTDLKRLFAYGMAIENK